MPPSLYLFSPIVNAEGEETQSDLDLLHLPGNSGMEDLPNLVSMCAITELLNVIHFGSYSSMKMPPEDRVMAVHVRYLTRTTWQWLTSTHILEDEENHWRDAGIVRGTCVYWAKRLLEGITHCEKSGIEPRIPGLTTDALRRELDGSLGVGWESEIRPISPVQHSFALIRTMRDVAREKVSPLASKFKFYFISYVWLSNPVPP
jgi:hypothetical protein